MYQFNKFYNSEDWTSMINTVNLDITWLVMHFGRSADPSSPSLRWGYRDHAVAKNKWLRIYFFTRAEDFVEFALVCG